MKVEIHQKVSVEWTINKLKLSDAPKGDIYSTLSEWANAEDGLRIYFDGPLTGAEAITGPVPTLLPPTIHGGEPEFSRYLIDSLGSEELVGQKKLLNIQFFKSGSEYVLSTNKFQMDTRQYYVTDDGGFSVAWTAISLDYAYCQRDEVEALHKKLGKHNYIPTKAQQPLTKVEKGFALLILHLANSDPNYRTKKQGRVNASEVQKLIEQLAADYAPFARSKKLNGVSSIHNEITTVLESMGLHDLDAGRPYE